MSHKISVACPQCGALVSVRVADCSQLVTCPDCLDEFVPAAQQAETSGPGEASSPSQPSDLAADFDLFTPDDTSPREGSLPDASLHPARSAANSPLDDITLNVGSLLGSPDDFETPSPARAVDPDQPYDFTAVCPLCGTRQDTTSEQIGARLRCPDCHVEFVVRAPPRSQRRPRGSLTAAAGEELVLRDTQARSPYEKLADDLLAAAARESVQKPAPPSGNLAPRDVVRQILEAAEKEVRQQEEAVPPLPDRPLSTRLLRFLVQPPALGRWILLSAALYVELGAIQMSVIAARGGGIAQILAIFSRIFATIFGVLFVTYLSTCLLCITQESAEGRDEIEGWPGANFLDWFFEGWPILASLFLALAPGLLLGQLAYAAADDSDWMVWFGLGLGALSMTIFYPVLALSFMENSAPYSGPIWHSVPKAIRYWGGCWWRCGAIVIGLLLIGELRWRSTSSVMNFALAAAAILLVMVYFRVLGRLLWACQEKMLAEPDSEEADEQAPAK